MMLTGVDMQRRVKELFPPGPFSALPSMGLCQDIPQKAPWQEWNAILEAAMLKLETNESLLDLTKDVPATTPLTTEHTENTERKDNLYLCVVVFSVYSVCVVVVYILKGCQIKKKKVLFNVMCQKSHQWREAQRVVWMHDNTANGQKRKEWV